MNKYSFCLGETQIILAKACFFYKDLKEKQLVQQYGLIGQRLGHSFSPAYFAKKFKELGLKADYQAYEMPDLNGLRAWGAALPALRGLNITIPYKSAVIPHLDGLSPAAAAIGAVNTIQIWPDGRWLGHNTDVIGFAQALDEWLAGQPTPPALVLGTGGAAKAVCQVLGGRAGYQSVSRQPVPGVMGYADIDAQLLTQHPLVINTTPLGMHPDVTGLPPIPYHLLGPQHLLYDLVYNPTETHFMQKGLQRGCRVCNGYRMLVLQAEAAWHIWQQVPWG